VSGEEVAESVGGPATDPARRRTTSPALALGDAWVIVELAPDAVLVVDERGRIELANRAAEVMFGCGRDSLIGLNVDALVPDARRELHRRHREVFATVPQARPMGVGVDLWARRADGSEVAVDISLSPVTFGHGPRIVAIVREVTEHRHEEQETRRRLILADEERIGALLQERITTRLSAAGLALEAAMNRASPEVAHRLRDVIDELDAVLLEIRTAVFGGQ